MYVIARIFYIKRGLDVCGHGAEPQIVGLYDNYSAVEVFGKHKKIYSFLFIISGDLNVVSKVVLLRWKTVFSFTSATNLMLVKPRFV